VPQRPVPADPGQVHRPHGKATGGWAGHGEKVRDIPLSGLRREFDEIEAEEGLDDDGRALLD